MNSTFSMPPTKEQTRSLSLRAILKGSDTARKLAPGFAALPRASVFRRRHQFSITSRTYANFVSEKKMATGSAANTPGRSGT